MQKDKGMTLVVLAAGMGSRFGGLKQLEPLSEDGNILIEYLVYDAIQAGFDKVVFIVRRTFVDEFKKLVAGLAQHVTVEYAFQDEYEPPGVTLPEREKPWGTGHALLAAEHLIDQPMAVINADDYYGQSAYSTAAEFLDRQSVESKHYAMLGYVLRSVLSDHGTVSRGICQLADNGMLASIVEHHNVFDDSGTVRADDGDGQQYTDQRADETAAERGRGRDVIAREQVTPQQREYQHHGETGGEEQGQRSANEGEHSLPAKLHLDPGRQRSAVQDGRGITGEHGKYPP